MSGAIERGVAIPTSGVARRRLKAVHNRRCVHARENDRRVAAGGFPIHWAALDVCPCGRIAWLEEGASDEARDAFYDESRAHLDYCAGGDL